MKNILNISIQKDNLTYITVMFFSLLFFGVLAILIIFNIFNINYWENIIVSNLGHYALKHPLKPVIFITNFGSVFWILPFSVIIAVLFLTLKRFKEALFIFMMNVGAGVLTLSLKWLIGRPRPSLSPFMASTTHSFPSGHTTLATCVYGGLIFLAYVYIKNKPLKVLIITLLSILILLVGISRVCLGAHFPTDVLGGLCIGAFWVTLCSLVYKKYSSGKN